MTSYSNPSRVFQTQQPLIVLYLLRALDSPNDDISMHESCEESLKPIGVEQVGE